MKLRYILISIFLLQCSVIFPQKNTYKRDSAIIDELNKKAFEIRLTDPTQTLHIGFKALKMASQKGYKNEIAESSRIIGIGFYNNQNADSALKKYNESLAIFKETKNIRGQARVYNNIGNLYREIDFPEGMKYFLLSLRIAEHAGMDDLVAGTYLNIGIIYHRQEQYQKALANFDKSHSIFRKLKYEPGRIMCLQNKGVVNFALMKYDKSEQLLLEANSRAKRNNLNKVVASINLTLASIYIKTNNFSRAQFIINEGMHYSQLAKNKDLERDYIWKSYELENKRKNYKKALFFFNTVYAIDSADFDNAKSEQIKLLAEQSKLLQKEKENQLIIERQKKNKILLFAAIIVSALSFIVILLLIKNVKKKAKTNYQLKILNEEISLQKENLNSVNQNLEKIIDERTKDLQIKNRKLSEYSSHLSHQIRGPVATMKGLMILQKERLIENEEFIKEIGTCVNQVDDRIININDVLHNLSESGLIPKVVDKEIKS